MFSPQFENTRAQDFEPMFPEAGASYYGKKEAWLKSSALFGLHSQAYLPTRNLACDIDSLRDFESAKKLY